MSNTPRLLITRFSPHAQILTEALNKVGFFSIAQPLLTIKPIKDPITLSKFIHGNYDIVIAVSGNAVESSQLLVENNWPNAIYLAIGSSTQKLLANASGREVLSPVDSANSEGLLMLPLLESIEGKRVLILRGVGGREYLDKILTERGAIVEFLESYKRIKLDLNGDELVNYWQQALINGAIISSVEILNQLFSLVGSKNKSWLTGLKMYVPSQRVADYAFQLGAKDVELLPSLSTDNIVEFFNKKNGNCI